MPSIIKGHPIYILIFEGQIIGTWSNLKHLCRDMSERENFASYSKLSKDVVELRRDGNATLSLSFATKDGKKYQLQIELLQ